MSLDIVLIHCIIYYNNNTKCQDASYLGDQCMSLDIGFETIVLLIETIIQNDRMHISAIKV